MRILRVPFAAALLALGLAPPLVAQRATVSGRVVDAQTGAGLAGAMVEVGPGGRADATDQTGAFELRLRPGREYILVVTRLGYAEQEVAISLGPNATAQTIDFALTPEPLVLEGVEVVVDRFEARRHTTTMSSFVLNRDRLARFGGGDLPHAVRSAAMIMTTPCASGYPPAAGWTRLASFRHEALGVDNCISYRGSIVPVSVYIDDRPVFGGFEALQGYSPSDMHHVEVYQRGAMVRVYTLAYVENLARTNRRLPPLHRWPP